MGSLPGTMRREMARIGPIWGSDIQKHREIVLAAYAPLLAQAPKAGIAVERDIAYGAHPRQVLDVYRPDAKRPVPVVFFGAGGAVVRGNKNL
jgi:acetyl esterase